MKLAIVGSRTISDSEKVFEFLQVHSDSLTEPITEIVSGGARGIDSIAREWAKSKGIPIKEFIPEWDKYGKSAGFRRNADIWDYADSGIAFWDGLSKGTEHSVKLSAERGKRLTMIVMSAT